MTLQGLTPEKRMKFIQQVSDAVLQHVMHRFDTMETELHKVSSEAVDEKESLVYSQEIIDNIIQALAIATIGALEAGDGGDEDYSQYAKSVGNALERIGGTLKKRFVQQDLDHEDVEMLKKEFGSLKNSHLAMEKAFDSVGDDLEELDKSSNENTQRNHALEEGLHVITDKYSDLASSVQSLQQSVGSHEASVRDVHESIVVYHTTLHKLMSMVEDDHKKLVSLEFDLHDLRIGRKTHDSHDAYETDEEEEEGNGRAEEYDSDDFDEDVIEGFTQEHEKDRPETDRSAKTAVRGLRGRPRP